MLLSNKKKILTTPIIQNQNIQKKKILIEDTPRDILGLNLNSRLNNTSKIDAHTRGIGGMALHMRK